MLLLTAISFKSIIFIFSKNETHNNNFKQKRTQNLNAALPA